MYIGKKYNVFGEELTVPQACRKYGVSRTALDKRMKEKGFSVEEAVADVVAKQETHKYTYRGQRMTLSECCKAAGALVERRYAQSRLDKGWSIERAVETPVIKRQSAKAEEAPEEAVEPQEQQAEEPENWRIKEPGGGRQAPAKMRSIRTGKGGCGGLRMDDGQRRGAGIRAEMHQSRQDIRVCGRYHGIPGRRRGRMGGYHGVLQIRRHRKRFQADGARAGWVRGEILRIRRRKNGGGAMI